MTKVTPVCRGGCFAQQFECDCAYTMAMAVNADKSATLTSYADGLVADLRDNVQKAMGTFDADAIHDARVATRRLSAAMELLQPVLSGRPRKKFERVLRKLRRRLGPLRDLDVMIDHLRELAEKAEANQDSSAESQAPSPGPYAGAISWAIAHLEAQRSDARKKAAKKSVARLMESLSSYWSLHDELTDASQAANSLLANSIHLQLDAFSERAQPKSDPSQTAPEPSTPASAAEPSASDQTDAGSSPPRASGRPDPHALRKAGKALRYTLELADETDHSLPAGAIRAFKKLQDALGDWHDMVVLANTIMQASLDEMLAYHDVQLQLRVMELARLIIRRSARALARFDRLWERRGEPLTASIRRAFPLTQDITAAPPAPTAPVAPDPQQAQDPSPQ